MSPKPSMRIAGGSNKALPKKFPFTRARLDAVVVPEGKDRIYVFDASQSALAYMKARGGTEKYYFYKKINGQPRRYEIADGSISVDDARVIIRRQLVDYADGIDVRQRQLENRKLMSVQQLFLHWRAVEGAKKRSISQYEDFFDMATSIHGRKINNVSQHDVATLHSNLGETSGHYTANRVLAILSIIFRWANNHYGINNPVKGIKRFPEYARERFLQPDELARFIAAIESEPDPLWKDFWKLLLYTGARRDNVAAMRWEDVDLTSKVWRIPAHSAKGKKMVSVPLSDDAVTILKSRHKPRESREWVFPSYSSTGRIMEPKGAWKRLLERAKITDLRIHDIRRTVGSYMAMSGVTDRLIGGALGQTTAQATNVYARLRTEPVRQAMLVGMEAFQAALKANPMPAKRKTRRKSP